MVQVDLLFCMGSCPLRVQDHPSRATDGPGPLGGPILFRSEMVRWVQVKVFLPEPQQAIATQASEATSRPDTHGNQEQEDAEDASNKGHRYERSDPMLLGALLTLL